MEKKKQKKKKTHRSRAYTQHAIYLIIKYCSPFSFYGNLKNLNITRTYIIQKHRK